MVVSADALIGTAQIATTAAAAPKADFCKRSFTLIGIAPYLAF
jgi:hypothetical protein